MNKNAVMFLTFFTMFVALCLAYLMIIATSQKETPTSMQTKAAELQDVSVSPYPTIGGSDPQDTLVEDVSGEIISLQNSLQTSYKTSDQRLYDIDSSIDDMLKTTSDAPLLQ